MFLTQRETGIALSDCVAPNSIQLLLSCARARNVDRDRVRASAQEITDWDALTVVAEFHGLSALVCRTMEGVCPDLVPENVVSRLRDGYRDSARRNLVLTSQLFSLISAFQIEGIDVMPLKGPVLAELLYPDPVLRPFSDLDILVRKTDVPAAMRVLSLEEYRLGAHLARLSLHTVLNLNCELLFRHERAAHVDLHWEIGPADYPFRFDTDILWRSSSQIRIAGRQVASLFPESLLLFMCVHGTKHMWSRLLWLGDVARLVSAPLDWSVAFELAAEASCTRPLLLGLLLVHEILEAPVDEQFLKRARAIEAVRLRAKEATRRLTFAVPTEPQSWELTVFNARMAERTWDKARHCAALLKAPTERELELLSLPERLFFLYYPLRVARLALKYGSRELADEPGVCPPG